MDRVFDASGRIAHALAVLTKLLLAAIVLLVAADVAARNLARPIAWSVSLTEYLLVYVAFLPMPALVRGKGPVLVVGGAGYIDATSGLGRADAIVAAFNGGYRDRGDTVERQRAGRVLGVPRGIGGDGGDNERTVGGGRLNGRRPPALRVDNNRLAIDFQRRADPGGAGEDDAIRGFRRVDGVVAAFDGGDDDRALLQRPVPQQIACQ